MNAAFLRPGGLAHCLPVAVPTAVTAPLALLLLVCMFPASSRAASFQDFFTNRQTVTASSGSLSGDNSTATFEVGEPQHGGKPGGHSLWISWVAPTNGIATFRTDGSSFDTLLSASYFGSTNDTTVDKLHEAARNDDYPGIQPASLIEFGVLAGQHYEIAVDGYYGATGSVSLSWSFVSAASPPPIVVSTPNDQAARQGDPVTLTVNLQTFGSVQLRWRLDEVDLDEQSTNLVIPSLQPTNVGRYDLRITIGSVRFFTTPTEIQINSEGIATVLAQDKLLDAPGSALEGQDSSAPTFSKSLKINFSPLGLGVLRGYSGSQVFDTTYATVDPSEPPHCGVAGGASYWLAYPPPTNGTITLDTIGSTFDTVLQAYTTNGPLNSYADLISLACDNDSVAPQGAARVTFPVIKTRQYYIVVDGVNGAKGTAWLNYKLDTNSLPQAPALLAPISARVAVPGTPVMLAPSLSGSPPIRFAWRKEQTMIQGATNASLFFPTVTTNDSANYTLSVTNDLGTLTATLPLHVVIAPNCVLTRTSSGARLSWPTVSGQRYTIEESVALSGPWVAWTNSFNGDGSTNLVDLAVADTRFYRVRVQ